MSPLLKALCVWATAASACASAAAPSASLRLDVFANSALVAPAQRTLSVPAAAVSLPLGGFLSAELSGTFSPPLAAGARFDFACVNVAGLARLFVWVDDHLVCQLGAFNNSANGMMDSTNFALLSKSVLPLRAHAYPAASAGGGNASFELQWCVPSGAPCAPVPPAALDAALPAAELARRALQQRAASGWGSWLHRDILSVVLLPDSACLTVQLCHLPTGLCLESIQIDGNGAQGELPVRVGAHAVDHSYSQAYVSFLFLNVSIEYGVSNDGDGLDLVVTPQPGSVSVDQYAVVFAGRFAWGRLGAFEASPAGLSFAGAGGLANVTLGVTAPRLPPASLPEIHAPGFPYDFPCQADRECSSESCSCNENGCLGLCAKETPLVSFGAAFPAAGGGAVGLSTTAGASLADVEARVAAARTAATASFARFGAALAPTTEAVSSALGWSYIYVPVEYGPMISTSFGFTWISPAPTSFDYAYVTFDCKSQSCALSPRVDARAVSPQRPETNRVAPPRDDLAANPKKTGDNILMAFEAGVLGARDAAYSSLVQVIKSKSSDGFVPNWYSGGSKSQQAEPLLGSKVLLDLYTRFGDAWLVELLFDDLLDWSNWTWDRRRVVVPGSACCDEPGYISVGNDYATCVDACDCVNSFKGESGLDQSPKWDGIGAAPDGSGGDCTGMAVNGSRVLQMGETQSSSLFVADAEALATLAGAINRTAEQALLLARAAAMRAQVARLFDVQQQSYMDLYAQTGLFSTRLSPTSYYPLLALAGAAPPGQVAAMIGHLLNASEFCVSADYASNPERCYWGLPSIAASDPAYMKPLQYVYWRGLVWAPMSLLTYWSLDAVRGVSAPAGAAAAALAIQKNAQFMDIWQRARNVCENYSPYSPTSLLPPGVNNGANLTNTRCTGWGLYAWGALNGLLSILEVQRTAAATTAA